MSNCNCSARLGLLGLLYCIHYDSGNGMQTCGVPGTSHACAMITVRVRSTPCQAVGVVSHRPPRPNMPTRPELFLASVVGRIEAKVKCRRIKVGLPIIVLRPVGTYISDCTAILSCGLCTE